MAELLTLARPYAKAAFEFSRSAKDLSSWEETLKTSSAVVENSKVKALLSSPNMTPQQKGEHFVELCGKSIDAKQANFLSLLAENNRLSLLPEISELFGLFKAHFEKTVDVDIQAAFSISPEIEKKIATALAEKLDRKVSLKTSVDNELIGGALIRAGDTVIDGTARGRLAKLAEAIGA